MIDWLVALGVLGRTGGTANDIYSCFAFQFEWFERQILHVNLNTVKHILILARTMQYLVIWNYTESERQDRNR